MEVTINIKTGKYFVKKAKIIGRKLAVYLPKSFIGNDVLCIPLLSPDMIIVNEKEYGEYLINCCGIEMFKKEVKQKIENHKVVNGYVSVPLEYLDNDFLIIPLN